MLTKKRIISSLESLPEEDFKDIDILLERIILLQKIDKAETDISEGKAYSTEEAKEKLHKWLK